MCWRLHRQWNAPGVLLVQNESTYDDRHRGPRDGAAAVAGYRAIDFLGASHRGGKIFVKKLFGGVVRDTRHAPFGGSPERALLERARRRKKGSARKRHRRALAAEGLGAPLRFLPFPSFPPHASPSTDTFFFLHVRESNGRYVRVAYYTRSAGIRV